VSEEVNRKLPVRNTTVQLFTLYTDPERHNAQRYRRTDRRADRQRYDAKSRSHCVQYDLLKTDAAVLSILPVVVRIIFSRTN